VDGLGRLTEVAETGIGANTSYAYDALDDLTTVTPASGYGRSFSNSSLKRLTSATNPETGLSTPVTYAYDPNGNLVTRAAGGITTTYTYDELDELTAKTYSDYNTINPTPWATYTYSKGWRTSAFAGSTSYAYTIFDGLGRATAATQTTSGTAYPFTYSYNLVDEIWKMTMPSGTVVTTAYDLLGRPYEVEGQASSAPTATLYANVQSRTPAGAIQQVALGNGLTEQSCFNNMQQPFVVRQRRASATSCLTGTGADGNDVGYLSYTFPTGNNGNVAGQTIQYGPGPSGSYGTKTFQQNYSYDGVNRLSGVNETGGSAPWSQSFGYDLVGNRWLSGGTAIDVATTPTTDVFNANNQINATSYDAKGNQTQSGGFVFQYDAESRLITTNMLGTSYGYDADGRRVTKTTSGVTTAYVYDVTGQLAAQYATGTGTAPCPTTCYLMTDHLGSTRMQTDSGGNQLTLYDYAPFGEELAGLDGRDARWGGFGSGVHFTGKEQEGYEGDYMHYFGARYFSAGLGRYTSPDRPLADQDPGDPQSWNLYTYVINNPMANIDPTGQDCVYANDFSSSGTVGLQRGNCTQKGGVYYEGTIDEKSFTFNSASGQLGFSYKNGDAFGSVVIGGLSAPPSDPLPPGVGAMLHEAGARASRDTSTFMISSAAFATALVSTYAVPAALAGYAALGETGAVGPGAGLLKLAQRYGLNLGSAKSRQILESLDMSVEEFIGKYKLGSIKQAPGWRFGGMSVREALDAGARKLLTDGRFDKSR
jgi:RHS repeat-associated protein